MIWNITGGIFCFAVGWCGSYFLMEHRETIPVSTAISRSVLISSEKIAVVNLDVGIKKNGDVLYYANRIIEYPSQNYQTTSLEDAKSGVENGRYAAYIIIPATFSESVESINNEPKQAVFSYKISTYLDPDTREKIIYEVNHFEQNVNTNISYIYVNAILEEVHQLQDDSVLIMKNDSSDLDGMLKVSAQDLIQSVKFSEFKEKEDPIKEINLTKEEKNMKNAVKSINNNYDEALKNGRTAFFSLLKNKSAVTTSLTELKTKVQKSNPVLNIEGKSLLLEGITNLENEVNIVNGNMLSKRDDLNRSIVEQIDAYAANNQVKLNKEQEKIQGSISTSVMADFQKVVDAYLMDVSKKNAAYIEEQNATISSGGH